jgi:3'(2'), 5'-bisphosphate nucleotidase
MTNLSRELEVARATAIEAGRIVLGVYGRQFDVEQKGAGAGPVTEADRLANEFIVGALKGAFPADGIVAEESADNSDARRFERCWYVDPLDGTKEFISRNGEFAIHIGLAIAGDATLGVVFKPVGGKLYAGTLQGGSTLEQDGQKRALHVSERRDPAQLRLVVSRSHHSRRTDQIKDLLGIQQVIESGSVGVKCGLLSEAIVDLYLHPSRKSSRWDSCAPEAVLRGAGGHLTDLSGQRYRYDGVELQNDRGLIGCNAAAFDAILPIVAKVMQGQAE